MITQAMEKNESSSVKTSLQHQQNLQASWQHAKRLTEIAIGDKVDIRDREYVWTEGTIKLIVES